MKNDLTCGVVRDLLPSYVEGLLGEEAQKAVEHHLDGCPDCTARKDAMNAQAEEAEETEREVDYLKRVKRANRKRIIVSVIATAVGLLAALALKVFVIGTPLQAQSVAVTGVHDEGDRLWLALSAADSASAFHNWKVETVDGAASIYARHVLVSPLYSSGGAHLYVPLEGVREVWLGGTTQRLIWAEGMIIAQETLDLLDAKAPYCGDAPSLGRIAELLQVRNRVGPYAMSLQTSARPYRWTLEFQEAQEPSAKTWGLAQLCAYQMLALVENLDEAGYDFPSSGGVLTAEAASAALARMTEEYNAANGTAWPIHESVKEYAESPLEYQRMVTLLEEMLDYRG